MSRLGIAKALPLALALSLPRPAHAAPGQPAGSEQRTLAAGPQYEASAFHRFWFGSGYRRLWTAPLQVEVLDLGRFGGGLVPEKKGGGKQTRTLHLEGGDGREWRFRSIDKDPDAVLPSSLRDTFAARIVQDQISAAFPLAVLVVDRLAQAAAVPFVEHRLVVLPDDARLGQFREEFRNLLGTLEEKPSVEPPVTPGFERFSAVVDTDELEALLDGCPGERVDARAYLRARLLDVLVGDMDRHRDQWDWARDQATGRFVAVPKDRDLALVRFDGRLTVVARRANPHLEAFGPEFPSALALGWQARFVDRRHLAELTWPEWREVAAELQASLTDEVIDAAAARLPASYRKIDGGFLASSLKARRDRLEGAARSLYELLAREAEVHGTDEPEQARILRAADGSVEIVLAASKGEYFRRSFRADETDEVRVFLKGGDDRVVSEGPAHGGVKVRVVGGRGQDSLEDSAGHTRFYDDDGDSRVKAGPGTIVSAAAYREPLDGDGNPERDWGARMEFLPWLRASEDYGLLLGGEWRWMRFGFRRHPYAHRHLVRAGYGTRADSGGVQYEYEERRPGGSVRFHIAARASALDVIHFYGFGNETSAEGPEERFDVRQTQYVLAPSYQASLLGVRASMGPVLKLVDAREGDASVIAEQQPYGYGRFAQAGAQVRLALGAGTQRAQRRSGVTGLVQAAFYPTALDAEESFTRVEGVVAASLSPELPLEPELALRAGGVQLFGRYPFHEAATLGGDASLRGLPRERYTGDASAYANAELRLALLRRDKAVVPRAGVFVLADVGRVFLDGESSDRWHTGWGGGIWLSAGHPRRVVSFALARSEGELRFYVQGGFGF